MLLVKRTKADGVCEAEVVREPGVAFGVVPWQ